MLRRASFYQLNIPCLVESVENVPSTVLPSVVSRRNPKKMTATLRLSILLVGLCLALVTADLCDVCKCKDLDNDDKSVTPILELKCSGLQKNAKSAKISFENLQWPLTDRNIHAYFNDMTLLVLPKLPGASNVVSLNFDNNKIRTIATEPFQHLTNLKRLSVANNRLTTLTPDFLRMKGKLEYLNLANNSLTEIDSDVLRQLDELKLLDLSLNEINKVNKEFVTILRAVEAVNLHGNRIYVIEPADEIVAWTTLNLSKNHMTVITASTFANFKNLSTISLSNNKIINIDDFAFRELDSLSWLSLTSNAIEELSLQLPQSIEKVFLDFNKLKVWPFMGTLANVQVIYLQNNQLNELYQPEDRFENLQILNVSNNNIEVLPSNLLPALKILDLSFNHLTAVPQGLRTRTPMLETLILDNNDIENIVFHDATELAHLSISNMPKLTMLEDYTFSKLVGVRVRQDGTGTCVDIKISHCPLLAEIQEKTFEGVNFCALDLSYNQLTVLPRNLTNWRLIEDGVNLQGNPFVCSCDSQWMLDVILKVLYQKKEHQYLLKDLTCGGPDPFTSTRFVKYYRRPYAFCNPSAAMVMSAGFGNSDYTEEPEVAYGKGPNFVTIIVCSALVLLALVAAGVYLTIEQRRRLSRKNRRF